MRHELLAEQVVGGVHHLVFAPAEFHAAGLAAAAGVDLGLGPPRACRRSRGPVGGLFGTVGERTLGNRHTEAGQDFLGLVFVISMI